MKRLKLAHDFSETLGEKMTEAEKSQGALQKILDKPLLGCKPRPKTVKIGNQLLAVFRSS